MLAKSRGRKCFPFTLALIVCAVVGSIGLYQHERRPAERTSIVNLRSAMVEGSSLEVSLALKESSDGGVSALVITIRNISTNQVITLKHHQEMNAFILITLRDLNGQRLSLEPKQFQHGEPQLFQLENLPPGSSKNWTVPIKSRLKPIITITRRKQMFLTLAVSLFYADADAAGVGTPGNFIHPPLCHFSAVRFSVTPGSLK